MRAAINIVGWLLAITVAYWPGLDLGIDRIDALAATVTTVCVLNLCVRR